MSLRNWLYDYPVVTIIVVFWGLAIVTFATIAVFTNMGDVTPTIGTCFGGIIGIPATVLGLWQWRMGKKEEKEKEIAAQKN